jgi:hypothetical protein
VPPVKTIITKYFSNSVAGGKGREGGMKEE